MKQIKKVTSFFTGETHLPIRRDTFAQRMHIDIPLLLGIITLVLSGLFILYSAANQDVGMIEQQAIKIVAAFILMIALAQIPPEKYRTWAPWIFGFSLMLLVAVLLVGHTGKGATRWLNLGPVRFQPSELMKLALPLMLAWFFQGKQLPPRFFAIVLAVIFIAIPAALIAKQPDLGTALLIAGSGSFVLLLAGMSWWLILLILIAAGSCTPVLWHFLHDYQKQRVLTFLNPENDPLGTGYHIIQSKIAIGSGGLFGKGWLHGTQSHLSFLPEHATDFIFAVCGEELGLIGCVALLIIYFYIISRCLFIAMQAKDTFSRLVVGSLTLTFFLCMTINIGMVTGILPVVGVPLPLVSYGGTSVVTVLASFGIIMSIHSHRKLLA